MTAHLIFDDRPTDADTLIARGSALAGGLRRMGVQEGDVIGVLLRNAPAYIDVMHACRIAGCQFCPINWHFTPAEVEFLVRDSGAKVLIGDRDLVDAVAPQLPPHVQLLRVDAEGTDRADGYANWLALQTPYDGPLVSPRGHMAYTSGTTGRPKGVVYSHRSTILHTLVGCLGDFWGLKGSDVILPVTPMFHANSWGIPYGAVMMGVKLVFPGPHLHPEDLLDLMTAEPPTLSLGVPTIWMGLIQAFEAAQTTQPGRWKLPTGMRSLVGGAAVPEALIRAFDRHGIWLLQGWGMTETSPLCTVSYPKSELKDAPLDERYRRAAMAGVPVPLTELRIRGDDGLDAPWDGQHVGEIQVRGPFITGSYHQVPVSEDKFSADGWLRTGDVASVDALGFVRITDRTKDLIKSGGEWISSVDLENALMAHPDVAEAAVIAIPDPKWSERPLACIVLKSGQAQGQAPRPEDFAAHLQQHGFAKWQVPDRYEFIDAVPRTSTGKFYKLKLRERFPA